MKEMQPNGERLTGLTQKRYHKNMSQANHGENSFMAENNGEIKQPTVKQAAEDRQNQTPQTPPEIFNQIKKIELDKSTNNVKEIFKDKPLKKWETEDLKREYQRSLKTEQEAEAKVEGFAEKEKIAAEAQSDNLILIKELKERGVDVQNLFLETAKSSAEEGRPLRSIGAASAAPREEIIDKSGITNESLLKELEAIDSLAGLGTSTEEILMESLQRVTVASGGKSPAEVKEFGEEKEIIIDRIREKTKEIIKEKTEKINKEYRAQGLYGERKLTENEKEKIKTARKSEDVEKLFNRMFDRVDSRPQADFNTAFGSIGVFEHDEFMKTLNEAITKNKEIGNGSVPIEYNLDGTPKKYITGTERAQELSLIVQQFANERAAREIIHNAYFGVLSGVDTEGMAKFIDGFQSGWADMAFGKAGVTQAMHFYEQALLIVREKAGGYLKPKEVIGEMKTNDEGEVNKLARKFLEEANSSKEMIFGKDGKLLELEPWQIDRALSFARGMSIITGRTIEIAASSILPPGLSALSDQYAQRIIAELAPFRHAYKFSVGSKFTRVLAYVMDRGRNPWTTKEIEDWENMAYDKQMEVLNGLTPDGKDRFYGVLNPFEIGGLLSRSGWRVTGGKVSIIDGLIHAAGGKGREDEAWIGTGVQIERKRSDLLKGGSKKTEDIQKSKDAEVSIEKQLGAIADRTPLRLFLNIRSVQEATLKDWKNIEQIQPNINELVLLQEKAIRSKKPLDLSKASADTQEFVKKIRKVWNEGEKANFLKTLKNKDWKIPYTFGTDDVPYDQYDFETTGPRSVARRWADMKSAADASKAFREFIEGVDAYKNQEQIVGAMRKVYEGIKGYNEEDARKFTLRMAEGVMKFYEKDFKHRLPFGIGTMMGLVTGRSSAAQIAYGRGAMAWDELQSNEFTRLLRDNGMLTVEQQQQLQKKAGGGKKEVAWSYARTVLPLLALALAYYMYTQVVEEKKK